MNHDVETIRRLVAEVIGRLQAPPDAASRPAAASTAPASAHGHSQQAAGVVLADAVITLATLERIPAGTKRATHAAKAVVTPSAREFARDTGLELVRGTATATASRPSSPFLVAQAECDGAGKSRCAAIARSVPDAQQVPATGLADVVSAVTAHACRDGGRAVVLCGRPAVAVALANRSAGVRAVSARDPASLLAAIAECAANVIVIDPKTFPATAAERVCGEFSRREYGPPPRELAGPAPAPCSCKGHGHP